MKKFLDTAGLTHYDSQVKKLLAKKQPLLAGTPGQVVGFDADGAAQAVRGPSNPNLLDNAYWASRDAIINQRGQEEYSGAIYGPDRWKNRAANQTTRVMDGYVEIHSTENQADIHQPIEVPVGLIGQIVTLSALSCGDGIYSPNIGILSNSQQGNTAGTPSTDWQLLTTTVTIAPSAGSNNILSPRIFVSAGDGTIRVKAMKLELGPQQTLAHQDADGNWVLNDPPPNRALELAKCQRYQVELTTKGMGNYGVFCTGIAMSNNSISAFIPTPVSMRAKPTVSFKGKITAQTNEGQVAEISSMKTDNISANGVGVLLTTKTTNLTPGQCHNVWRFASLDADTSVLLDANL